LLILFGDGVVANVLLARSKGVVACASASFAQGVLIDLGRHLGCGADLRAKRLGVGNNVSGGLMSFCASAGPAIEAIAIET
jgi:hypothetical protein